MKGIKNVFIFFAGLVLTLGLLEIYLVGAEIAKSNWTVLDRDLGKTNKAGQKIIYFSEGFYLGKINEYRYVGPGYPMHEDTSVTRIKLIGDSFVEGLHVFDEYHFRTLLENKLNAIESLDSVQIMNFGKGIFDLYDMYCYDVNYSSAFESDLNLIFVHNIDFLEDRDPAMPHVYIENDSLYISRDFANNKRFKSYEKFKPLMNTAVGRLAFNCFKLFPDAPGILFDKFYLPFAKSPELPPDIIEFNQEAQKIIDAFAKDDRNIFVLFDDIQNDILEYIKDSGLKTIDLSDAIEQGRMTEYRIDYWDVTNEYGHLNHAGHDLISRKLFSELSQLLLN